MGESENPKNRVGINHQNIILMDILNLILDLLGNLPIIGGLLSGLLEGLLGGLLGGL